MQRRALIAMLAGTTLWASAASAAPEIDPDDPRWAAVPSLYGAVEGCWVLEGSATWEEQLGPWTRSAKLALRGTFRDGDWEELDWELTEPIQSDRPQARDPTPFDSRPAAIELWSLDPARAAATRLDTQLAGPGVHPRVAAWSEGSGAVELATSSELPGGGVLRSSLLLAPGANRADREVIELVRPERFAGAVVTPSLRVDDLRVELSTQPTERGPVPAGERVHVEVRRLGMAIRTDHQVAFTAPQPCP